MDHNVRYDVPKGFTGSKTLRDAAAHRFVGLIGGLVLNDCLETWIEILVL